MIWGGAEAAVLALGRGGECGGSFVCSLPAVWPGTGPQPGG